MLYDEHIEALILKYLKKEQIISLGTGEWNTAFLNKLALFNEENSLNLTIVPTSHALTGLCKKLKMKTVSLDDVDIDLAFDFVDQVDGDFNYISNDTASLVRDKMIAQTSAEMVVVVEEKGFVKKLTGPVVVEVSPFAIKKTIIQLMNLGEPTQRMLSDKPLVSETGNYFIDIKLDDVFSIDDFEYQAKNIPGVLETSLFIGYADRAIIHGDTIKVKSRMEFD